MNQEKQPSYYAIITVTVRYDERLKFAYSENPNLQDYALTGELYEDGKGIKTVNYIKNETKIIILKQDEEENNLVSARNVIEAE